MFTFSICNTLSGVGVIHPRFRVAFCASVVPSVKWVMSPSNLDRNSVITFDSLSTDAGEARVIAEEAL